MTAVVVDTDVVSYLFKQDTRAELYRPHLLGKLLLVSFMTVAELERWGLERNWGRKRRRKLDEHLRQFVLDPFDRELCRKWAEVSDQARRNGHPISTADAWVAASALLNDLPLVTHNRDDFAGVGNLIIISENR